MPLAAAGADRAGAGKQYVAGGRQREAGGKTELAGSTGAGPRCAVDAGAGDAGGEGVQLAGLGVLLALQAARVDRAGGAGAAVVLEREGPAVPAGLGRDDREA